MYRSIVLLLAATATLYSSTAQEASRSDWKTLNGKPPLVIAHRGASAQLPGHTLEAYELAIDQGADFIEPDLVMTKDDHLVCRHDRFLSTTTNVADLPEFASHRVEKEGRTDWWVEDFTLAEIKTLRNRQDYSHRSKQYDDQFAVPTLDEVIALAKRKSNESTKVVGIYPEPKQAAQYTEMGKDICAALVRTLEKAGWVSSGAPVIIQSFEVDVLKKLNKQVDLTLIQLTLSKTYFDKDAKDESFIDISTIPAYADGVGPSRMLIIDKQGNVNDFVQRAHDLGLVVHAWTLLGDQKSPDGLSPEAETRRMYDLGVDAVFADDPQQAIGIRDAQE